MEAVTTSAWEFEQQRDVARAIARLRRAPAIGEAFWTGRTDNAGIRVRSIRPPTFELDDVTLYDALNRASFS